MSVRPSNFELRPVVNEPGEVRSISELLRLVWPSSHVWRLDYLQWLYFANPRGPILGFNAWHKGGLAAHYVVMPIRARLGDTEVKAGLSLNVATSPEHRRSGLFVRLAEATHERARQVGLDHIVVVANANSTQGFLGRLGFQFVGQLDVLIGIGCPRLNTATPPTKACWQRVWSRTDLEWRLRNPAASYRHLDLKGCLAVLSPTDVPGIWAILRLGPRPENPDIVLRWCPERPRPGMRMWIGLLPGLRPAWVSARLPGRLKRSPLNLLFRPLQDVPLRLDREGVHFELLDFDAY